MTEPIEPTAPITVTLQAQEWNQVLGVLSDAPYRIVAPLIAKITAQGQAAAPALAAQPNGSAGHASDR